LIKVKCTGALHLTSQIQLRVKPNLALALTSKHGQKDNQGAET